MKKRIKSELKQTLNLNSPKCYDRLILDDIYKLISTKINKNKITTTTGEKIHNIINTHTSHIKNRSLIWLIYLGVMLDGLDTDDILKIAHQLNLSGIEAKILLSASTIIKNKDILLKSTTKFEVYEFFECHFLESILIVLASSTEPQIIAYIEEYLNKLQFINISTTGKTLIDKGFASGPEFGYILRDILKEKINGNIETKEDEDKFLDNISIIDYQMKC